jgi:hypothetical protein
VEASLLLSRTDGTSSSAFRSGHPANDRFVMEAVGRFETYPLHLVRQFCADLFSDCASAQSMHYGASQPLNVSCQICCRNWQLVTCALFKILGM